MNAFITTIRNLLSQIKLHKNYLFLILPFLLILFVIAASLILLQPSPSSNTTTNETIIVDTPTAIPTRPIFSSPTPTIALNPTQAYQDTLQKQERFEAEFAEEQAAIQRNYPWFDKLPLHTNTYFFYFDAETKRFIGKLYPKSSSQTSVNAQTAAFKAEIMNQLRNQGIPTTQYPITWQVIPAP